MIGSNRERLIHSNRGPIIHFIESSGRTCLTGRQACAVESIAVHNPRSPVKLLATGPPNSSCEFYRVIRNQKNVEVELIDLELTFSSTPFQSWYSSGRWKASKFLIEELSDALRLVVLWKNGGVYLDLDFVGLRPLKRFRNSIVNEDESRPASGILFFDRGHPFLLELMKTCAAQYQPDVWGVMGPTAVKATYEKFCESWNCKGVRKLPKDLVFPINYSEWQKYFEPQSASSVLKRADSCLAAHLWNRLSSNRSVRTGDGCAYDILAQRHCPSVYDVMKLNGHF